MSITREQINFLHLLSTVRSSKGENMRRYFRFQSESFRTSVVVVVGAAGSSIFSSTFASTFFARGEIFRFFELRFVRVVVAKTKE